MKKLQPLHWTEPSALQRGRLADWLRAWELDRRLSNVQFASEAKRPTDRGPVGEIASAIVGFDQETPTAGEIRLISSLLVPACPRPLYAAVLAEWEDGLWLISPYGRFAEPATPGELLTGRQAAALRVLCLWNTHSVPADVLQRSWLVEHISRQELDDSWCVFQHSVTGKELPSSLQARVGPPVFRNEDPRINYQEQEAAFLEPLKARAIEWAKQFPETQEGTQEENLIVLAGLVKQSEEQEFSLAAAGKKPPQRPRSLWIVSPPVQVRLTMEGDDKTVSIWVLDRKGEPASQLNGTKFLGKDGTELGTILDAQCLLRLDQITGGFQLITKDGKPLKVKQKGQR